MCGERSRMRRFLLVVCFYAALSAVSSTENDGTPSLSIRTRSSVYNIGEKKAIYCYGTNLPQRIEWYSPKNEQIGGRNNMVTRIYVERPKNESLESCLIPLIIQSLKMTDSGNWTCRAGPDLSESIEIFVGEKVKLTEEEEVVADQDKTAKLVCETKGTPEPVVQWYKDNSLIKGDDVNIFKTKKGDIHTLEIRNLNHMDRGTYLCRATQEKLSHYADKTFHLRVRHQPIITNVYQEREVYAILNEIKNITCSAIAYPPPTFSWAKRNEDKFDQIINDEETVYVAEDGSYSVLMLRVFNESALGQYKCSVHNNRGRQHIVFDVSLGNKPEPPTSVVAVEVTPHNITFNVTCATCLFEQEEGIAPRPDNLTVLGYNFQVVPCREGYSPYWINATEYAFDINNQTDTLFTVDSLTNGTEYHVRVATRNAAGLSDWFPVLPNPKTVDGAAALTISTTLLILACLTTWY